MKHILKDYKKYLKEKMLDEDDYNEIEEIKQFINPIENVNCDEDIWKKNLEKLEKSYEKCFEEYGPSKSFDEIPL